MALSFQGEPLDLAAQAVITHKDGKAAVFNGGFQHPATFRSSAFAAVSAIGGASPDSLLAVANCSERPRAVTIRTAGRRQPPVVELAAGETRLLKLRELTGAPESPPSGGGRKPAPVGLLIEHDGATGEVLAHGLLRAPGGEAANLHLVEPVKLESNRLVSPALRVLPTQSPLLALNNLTGGVGRIGPEPYAVPLDITIEKVEPRTVRPRDEVVVEIKLTEHWICR